jgi:nucleoside phosphorylase/CheY-like chemotaxis protein
MRVVIIDDDERKRLRITEVVQSSAGTGECVVECAESVSDGIKLMSTATDLLVLDLNLPLRRGESPQRDGGLRFLKQISKGVSGVIRPNHILGVTAHEDLLAVCDSEFRQEAWELLLCDPASQAWEEVVQNKVIHIASFAYGKTHTATADVAIISALKDVEFEAIQRLPGPWLRASIAGDDTRYFRTEWPSVNGGIRIVAAAAAEMGIAASSALTMKIACTFQPKIICMTGIAAGVKGNPGDILVADESWDYGSGKIESGENGEIIFKTGAKHIQLDPGLKEMVSHFNREHIDVLPRIRSEWPAKPPDAALQVVLGPFASGAAVVENKSLMNQVRGQDRKLIGLDMEAYGVFCAARLAPSPRPKCLVAKSLCDFGVPPKLDDWQPYAAYTSAQFIYHFVTQSLFSELK